MQFDGDLLYSQHITVLNVYEHVQPQWSLIL